VGKININTYFGKYLIKILPLRPATMQVLCTY